MKNVMNWKVLAGIVLMGAGLAATGCKSAPELTAAQAQSLIQAKYDQTAPVGATVTVNDAGLQEGVTAKYWEGKQKYPNGYWVDLKLTDAGKKVLKLQSGGDTIQWHPEQPKDPHYSIVVVTQAANHLKARDVTNIQDETLPNASAAKSASYTEVVDLTGVPDALQDIAHNAGNQLSTKRQADFVLDNGSWKLQSIQ